MRKSTALVLLTVLTVPLLAGPLIVVAQENDAPERTSIWDRVYFGLALKTWIVIIIVIIVVSIILEGLGWVLILFGIGYILWLLLR